MWSTLSEPQQHRLLTVLGAMVVQAHASCPWRPPMNASHHIEPHRGVQRSAKIGSRHLELLAIVFVRQSSPGQVLHHQESARLQYSLKERAISLGWQADRVLIIDDDQGHSASEAAESRLGFQKLVAEVGLGHVGIILGLDMSRLARRSRDWHQLLEVCALFGTLLSDLDGIYDPSNYNDRLLLGLKGTISEAELHSIRQRMDAGLQAKAARGELFTLVKAGYFRRPSGEIIKDPDEQVQTVINLIFEEYRKHGSVIGVMHYFQQHDLKLPVRPFRGPNKGDLMWRRASRLALYSILTHPMYAGAYVYGRVRLDLRAHKPGRRGTGRKLMPRDQWTVLLRDRIPAYITWEQYEENLRQLARSRTREQGVARNGAALLTGIAYCGRCGHHMSTHYSFHQNRYFCQTGAQYGDPTCGSLAARTIDLHVEALLLRALEPAALEVSLRVAADLEKERVRSDRVWEQRRERARYAVERARRQYSVVEPENRLVARLVEQDLEARLREQQQIEEEHHRYVSARPATLSEEDRDTIRRLVSDLPALWHAPTTTMAQRKEIVRQIIEGVWLKIENNTERVTVTIRWAGGHETKTEVRRPVAKTSQLSYYPELITRVEELRAEGLSYRQAAKTLNEEGWKSASFGGKFHERTLEELSTRTPAARANGDKRIKEELGPDEWTATGLATELGVPRPTMHCWIKKGIVRARKVTTGYPYGSWVVSADAADLARLRALKRRRRGLRWPRKTPDGAAP